MKSPLELLKNAPPTREENKSNAPDEAPVSSKPLFSTPPPSTDFFSHPDMGDLARVGKTKALGYLPLHLIRSSGFNELLPVIRALKANGLKVFIIPNAADEDIYAYNPSKKKYVHLGDNKEYKVVPKDSFVSIRSGALVAYDEEAVNTFLKDNVDLINEENRGESNSENQWPLVAADFVNMLFRKQAESKKMDDFVHQVYVEMPAQPKMSPAEDSPPSP